MSTTYDLTPVDKRDPDLLHLKRRDFERVQMWLDILRAFDAAPRKDVAIADLSAQYAGRVGITQSKLYRKRAAFQKRGWRGLLHKSKLKAQSAGLPPATEEFWQTLCCENQRVCSAAYRSLYFDYLIPGRPIPGLGTWIQIWRREHPGAEPPAECPYRPGSYEPEGMSYRTMTRYAPREAELDAARVGIHTAMNHMPKIPGTRVGLKFGQLFQMDDVYHDTRVMLIGNRTPQICVEMGALEVLSGHYCTYGIKPVRERDDGTREHLREAFTAYLLCDILCRIGVHADGCIIAGEHGTARMPARLLEIIDKWLPGVVEFKAGGLRHEPIGKGLYEGRPGGNFRFKAHLESHHALKKNELASLPGQKGANPDRSPEDLATKTREAELIMKAADALLDDCPDVARALQSEFPNYRQYVLAVGRLYDRIAMRYDHHLEGFHELGFRVERWRLLPNDPPRPFSDLDKMPPEDAEAIRAMVHKSPASRYCPRVMSPAEAFVTARDQEKDNLLTLPMELAPKILGEDLGQELSVNKQNELVIRDPYDTHTSFRASAYVRRSDGTDMALRRGELYLVHHSPFNPSVAYVSRPDLSFVGYAPVMIAAPRTDQDAVNRNLAIQNTALRGALKALEPIANKRRRERAERAEHNVRAITGHDVAQEIYEAEEAHAALMSHQVANEDFAAAVGHDSPAQEEDMGIDAIADMLSRK